MDYLLFVHFVGIVIALGAVTVIDSLGFLSRKSKEWAQVTVKAHHITKRLIWIGTIIVFISWVLMHYFDKVEAFSDLGLIKSILLIVMMVNGIFLSFYVSPNVDNYDGKNKLFSKSLQSKVIFSMMVSFLSWWSFVFITVWMIS